MPQLGLQQTWPTLQVFMPQGTLYGYWMALSQGVVSQSTPGAVQMPQLGLQQTSPTLQVLMPQLSLLGTGEALHTTCAQDSPGSAQIPQLSLQHS